MRTAESVEDAVTAAPAVCRSCGAAPTRAPDSVMRAGPLAASADAAEYKQVAVLFADAVRSMDIAVALDLGRLRSEQDPGYTLLSARPGEKG